VGFKDAQRAAIEALRQGRIQHEARAGAIDEKNLLLTGDVTPEQVVRLLSACRGTQHSSGPHHQVSSIEVHVFRPEARLEATAPKERWYIKLYFTEPDAWFISVHRSR
jgi:hypothetical protein